MNHIKLFKESSEEKLYKKISVKDYDEFKNKYNFLLSNSNDLDAFKGIFKGDISLSSRQFIHIAKDVYLCTPKKQIDIGQKNNSIRVSYSDNRPYFSNKVEIYCYKYDDNWWIVTIPSDYTFIYLCDDVDGLKELAKDFYLLSK